MQSFCDSGFPHLESEFEAFADNTRIGFHIRKEINGRGTLLKTIFSLLELLRFDQLNESETIQSFSTKSAEWRFFDKLSMILGNGHPAFEHKSNNEANCTEIMFLFWNCCYSKGELKTSTIPDALSGFVYDTRV